MKIACAFAACLLAFLQFSTASAQVYQWKDSTGRTVISDTPPPPAKNSRAISAAPVTGSKTSASDHATLPKTAAEKEMEFRKRQKEAKEKAEKEAREQQAAVERKDSCDRAKVQLATLESGERLVTRDESGGRRILDDTQRHQEMERAQKAIAENCK